MQKIQFGNNTTTTYAYDKKTFRLTRLMTTRNGTNILQKLEYDYKAGKQRHQ